MASLAQQQKDSLEKLRNVMVNMKKNQDMRGVEQLQIRMAARAKKNTWRQMSGMKLFMHEVNHSGNKPFVIGGCVTFTMMMYLYSLGLRSEQAKAESKYYQRFIAKHD